jgi:hypothetical protein
MTECTLSIDTGPGFVEDNPDVLDRLADVLYESDELIAPAVTVNPATRAIGATFNVRADGPIEAVQNGVGGFLEALAKAGIRDSGDAWDASETRLRSDRVTVEPADVEERVPA